MVKSRVMTGESATGEFDPFISLLPTCHGFSFLSFPAAKSFKDIFTFGIDGRGGGRAISNRDERRTLTTIRPMDMIPAGTSWIAKGMLKVGTLFGWRRLTPTFRRN